MDTPTIPLTPHVLQRQAADPTASVWVAASAGTGKTKVLTDRVLRLMLAGTSPQRILCLTFTKAAAAEMATRLTGVLSDWAILSDTALDEKLDMLLGRAATGDERNKARRLFADVLECPGGMKIQTLHSFCQSLLARFPIEANVRPGFLLAEERLVRELLTQAIHHIISSARSSQEDGQKTPLAEALALLTPRLTADDFQDLLSHIMSQRSLLYRLFQHHGGLEGLLESLRQFLGLSGTSKALFLESICGEQGFDRLSLQQAANALAEGSITDKKLGLILSQWLQTDDLGRQALFDAYSDGFLTSDAKQNAWKIRANLGTKETRKKCPDLGDILQREAQRLETSKDILLAWGIWEQTGALMRLSHDLLATYTQMKATRGWMDYDDLVLHARDLLTQHNAASWVLYKLDGGLDHLLVDEAQDTNPEQWQIIAALADEFFAGDSGRKAERTLFVVGDEKQSIFSFQRADVAEFNRMRHSFSERIQQAEKTFRPVDMTLSFRSTDAVLKAVDKIFSLPAARQGVISADSELRHHAYRRGQAGRVELWPLVTPSTPDTVLPWQAPLQRQREDVPSARLAAVIAAQIRSWLDTKEILESQGRPIRPGDVMILVRRRGDFFEHMVRALKNQNIPVTGLDRLVLNQQLAVKDLMALGQFLLLPEDNLTLAIVLKTPLIGFSEDDLYSLAEDRPKTHSLWQMLEEKAQTSPVFQRAHHWLKQLLVQTDFISPFALFDSVLSHPCPADKQSGRRAFLRRLGTEAEDPLEEFLSACLNFEQDHAPSLQRFLQWLTEDDSDIRREMSPADDKDEGQVRIMTVHASKGLQAPILFLPDMNTAPRGNSTKVFWPSVADLASPTPTRTVPLFMLRKEDDCRKARYVRDQEDQRRGEEYRRLFYVALTRAADRLYLAGWPDRNTSEETWYHLAQTALADFGHPVTYNFTTLTPEGWTGNGRRYHDVQTTAPEKSTAVLLKKESRPFPPELLRPATSEEAPSRPLTPSRPEILEPAFVSPLKDKRGNHFRRGLLLHRLLQVLPTLPQDQWPDSARRFLALPGHQLSSDEQENIITCVLNILQHADHAPLFGPHSQAEVPIVAVIGPHVISGQIDRLCILNDQVWIVDYKTHRPLSETQDRIPKAYVSQMATYRQAIQKLWPDKQVRAFLLWTDIPQIIEIPERLLDDSGRLS